MTRTREVTVLITGGRGQLGRDLVAAAGRAPAGTVVSLSAPGSDELDITDAAAVHDAVRALVGRSRLVVINAAAYTAVDDAETSGVGAAHAHAVNAEGPGHLAEACARHAAHLVQVSTDYVFGGDATAPYRVDDPAEPRSVYGRSKLAGERAVLGSDAPAHVVRTAWLYSTHGSNFVQTMARLERERATVTVVDDQYGCPTWSADLADGLIALALAADRVAPGLLHCVNTGWTSWYGLARAVFVELGADPARVRPCSTAEFPRPAPRPANSVLDSSAWAAAGLPTLRPWRQALASAMRSATW